MALDNFRTIELIWDKANKSIIKTIKTASSDTTGRYLSVKILDGGQEVTLNNAKLQLYWEHPDFNTSGIDDFNTVNNGGLFKMTFSREMLTNIGELTAHLVLTLTDGKITSDAFEIEVIKGANDGVVVPTNGSGLVKQIDGKIDKGNVTLDDLTQEVKEALTGGSVAVVGRNAVGKENIKKGSVTIGKTSFTHRGLNYFDGEYVEGVTLGYGTTPMSLLSGLPGRMTAIVPVEGGKTYRYEGYDETDRLLIAATKEYPIFSENAGESFVDYDLVRWGNTAKTYHELDVPVDANFLVISVSTDYKEPMVQVTDRVTPRTDYDRRIVPRNGGLQNVTFVNDPTDINFSYEDNKIYINHVEFIAYGRQFEIKSKTLDMLSNSNTLICFNINESKITQHQINEKLVIPDGEVILGSYTNDEDLNAINGFTNYSIDGIDSEDRSLLFDSVTGTSLEWELGSIRNDGGMISSASRIRTVDYYKVNNGYVKPDNNIKIIVMKYGLDRGIISSTEWTEGAVKIAEPCYIKIIIANKDDTEIEEEEISNMVSRVTLKVTPESTGSSGALASHKVRIGGIGIVDGGITSKLATEPVLASVKNAKYLSDGTLTEPLAIGFLYHGSGTDRNLYYSQNQADNLDKVGTLDFNPERYNAGIGEDGEIIWVNENGKSVYPRVHKAGQYDSSIELTGMANTPIAWLQNCGIDFARDANGEEYCVFGEYTGEKVEEIRLWKVTKPYSDPTNWRIVKTFNQSQIYKQGTENEVWHIHTVQHDPYTGIWYATSGDSDLETKWWYSTDEGESWTELLNGTYWESQVARVLNFVFTEDYIYWGNDYGTNHSLNRVARGASGVINPTTREKLAELNKNQSTYATVLTNSPKGILLLDRVDTDFSVRTNKLDVEFYSFDDKKIHVLDTLERLDNKSSYFGFRCKSYTLYQPIYDDRIVVGFGSSPNWIKLPYNTNENRNTLTLSIS